MPYKIDRFNFNDQTVKNFNRVGITPDKIQACFDDGRKNGITDERIGDFIIDQYNKLDEPNRRGRNTWGAGRVALSSIPLIGEGVDEAEAFIRSKIWDPKGLNLSYEDYLKNARESKESMLKAFKENAKEGGWASRNIVRYTPEIANVLNNALLATGTGGATLAPKIAGAQYGLEGFLSGEGTGERTARGIVGGALGYSIAKILNKLLPTRTTQQQTIKETAKSSDALQKYSAKALEQGITPEEVIAKEVPRGMRPDLWANMRRSSVGENAFRKDVLRQASNTYSKPYEQYIVEEVGGAVPKYAKKLGEEIGSMKLDQLADDLVGEIDPRKYVMDAVNKVMKNATPKEQNLAIDAMTNAIAKRGVAKKITTTAIERPINPSSGAIWNWLRRANAPLRNLWNKGTIRAMTVGTPNYEATNMLERLMNFYTPDWIRGGLDSLLRGYEKDTLK